MSPAWASPQPRVSLTTSLGLIPATRISNYQPGTQVSTSIKPKVSSLGLDPATRVPNYQSGTHPSHAYP